MTKQELNDNLGFADMEIQALNTSIEQLKKQLEEQVVYGEHLKKFIEYVKSLGMDLIVVECQKRLDSQPSPQLAAQFKADAIRELLPDRIDMNAQGDTGYKLGWNDFHREMRLIADQLTKDGDLL